MGIKSNLGVGIVLTDDKNYTSEYRDFSPSFFANSNLATKFLNFIYFCLGFT